MDDDRVSRRAALRRGGAVALAGSLAGCGLLDDGPVEAATVEMTDDLTFEPDAVRVLAGGTVTWETVGSVAHTVTADEDRIPDGATYFASGGFESESTARGNTADGLVRQGETFEHALETTGTYEYFCVPHENSGMVGSVTVTEP